ncbi:MAG: ABC transporter ATP-binding protein [Victivallaceae bacterium]|nr:ABC transporter ATP-binding protein [Victivallaceae bacterium]
MKIEFNHLFFEYGKNRVLSDVSFSVTGHGLSTIVGPNGSGKSTLLRLAAGILKPSAGEIIIDGAGGMVKERRAKLVSYLPQEQNTAALGVRETVMLGRNAWMSAFASPGKCDDGIVERAMRMFDVDRLVGRTLAELSGGERQRVMLATVVAQNTKILLLDEPTASMDVARAMDTMESLSLLAKTKSVVVVTHDLQLAMRYAENAVLIGNGKVVASGATTETLSPENLGSAYGCRCKIVGDGETRTICFIPGYTG